MYEQFFGLSRRPFSAAPDADCYFPATVMEAARQTLFRCIDRGEGAALLIGPAGTGKSLLLQVLAEQFRQRFEVALLGSGRVTTLRDLLQAILYELNLPYRDREEGDLRLALIDHLSDPRRLEAAATEGLLLLIDEAHTLPLRVLEEVRLITNLIRGGQPKVRLVLAGSPALEERFTSPKLDVFNQRVSARCYLQAFDRGETHEFIKAQIEWAAGQADPLFTAEALDTVYHATGGVPRLINQVCDHALVLACSSGARSLSKQAIEAAWSDLQQLPTPANRDLDSAVQNGAGVEVIEFGVLDDESSGAANAGPEAMIELTVNHGDSHEPQDHSGQVEIDVFDEIDLADDADVEITVQDTSELTSELGPANPLQRLAQVEDQIAAIDSDFESAVAFGPQVDLSFENGDPFGESFAEEELVIDPFAMTATDALANRPLVQSAEGHTLAALLKPLHESRGPRLSLASTDDADDLEGNEEPILYTSSPEDENSSPMQPATIMDCQSPGITFWSPDEPDAMVERLPPAPYASYSLQAEPAPVARKIDARYDEKVNEPPLIVIEDEPPSGHQATVVRRGQYRRLFSSLRRG